MNFEVVTGSYLEEVVRVSPWNPPREALVEDDCQRKDIHFLIEPRTIKLHGMTFVPSSAYGFRFNQFKSSFRAQAQASSLDKALK